MSDVPSVPARRRRFQFRSFISVVIGLAAIGLLTTGAVLFILPPGRIANRPDWTLLAVPKSGWQSLHVTLSALFLIAGALHIFFNWRPLAGYFKDRARTRLVFRWEWALGLVFGIAVTVGTFLGVPPFSTLMAFREEMKRSWDGRGCDEGVQAAGPGSEGAAPGHGAGGAGKGGWRGGGGGAGEGEGGGPGAGRGGYGRKTIAELCSEEGLVLDDALAVLASRGVTVDAGMTVRQVADLLGVRPSELPSMLGTARPKKTE